MQVNLIVSDEDLAVIAHVVPDAEAWVQHAFDNLGASAVRAKIDKYRDVYVADKARLGPGYKSRAARDAEAAASRQAEEQAVAQRLAEGAAVAATAQQAAFNAAVIAVVDRRLAEKGVT